MMRNPVQYGSLSAPRKKIYDCDSYPVDQSIVINFRLLVMTSYSIIDDVTTIQSLTENSDYFNKLILLILFLNQLFVRHRLLELLVIEFHFLLILNEKFDLIINLWSKIRCLRANTVAFLMSLLILLLFK